MEYYNLITRKFATVLHEAQGQCSQTIGKTFVLYTERGSKDILLMDRKEFHNKHRDAKIY